MTTKPSPWAVDADPVETAVAVAKTMRRLASETRNLTSLDAQAPQITDELLSALREMATVTTHLARLGFDHPTLPAPAGDLGAFPRSSPAVRAADKFTDATNLIYLACQPLAGAKNETTRLTGTAETDRKPPSPGPRPDHSRREEPTHQPSL
ncbi:hypothetical protein [Promicromonospora sp. NPDC050249]|uniref:hypothetical protein n=1 Tax=Promicromonospora sp. NPDC050249 TaxID=3154743 RepID=UPI0033D0536D